MEQAEGLERGFDDIATSIENRKAVTVGKHPRGPSRTERRS
jgi:hypothetical protein